MSIRQRAIDAIQHRTTDKVPYHITFTQPARDKMASFYGNPNFEASLGNCLSIYRARRLTEVRPNIWRDEFGVEWDRSIDTDIGVVATALITPDTLGAFEFPDPNDPSLYTDFQIAENQFGDTMSIAKLSYNLYERAWSLAGMETLLMSMVARPQFVHDLLDRICQYNLAVIENVCKWDVDAILFGDDWGGQSGLIMGPHLWREFIKPHITRLYQAAKAHGKHVFIHCCGAVQELFDELIECGVDVFNPFQPEVMDIYEMKRQFGDRLTFYGGISTQKTLPFATVSDVRNDVKRLLTEIGSNGGLIASPAHAIPGDAKPENIAAMIQVLQHQ
jgi:uroporphyrinogen decarboxylase